MNCNLTDRNTRLSHPGNLSAAIGFIAALTIFLLLPCRASSHELKDGFVEKIIEVVVRDNTAQMKFHLGVTQPTMVCLLENWNENKLSASQQKNPVDHFELECFSRLPSEVTVLFNGTSVPLRSAVIQKSLRHHFSYTAEFLFELPQGKDGELKIVDQSFQKMDSAIRYSIKTVGSAMLLRSNVAPIIVRSTRHDLSKMDEATRLQTCQIIATVAIGPEPKSTNQ